MTGTSSGLLAVDHLQDLDTLLTFAPSDASLWSSLLVSLEQAKAQLSRILDFPGPNPAEKQALEAGQEYLVHLTGQNTDLRAHRLIQTAGCRCLASLERVHHRSSLRLDPAQYL